MASLLMSLGLSARTEDGRDLKAQSQFYKNDNLKDIGPTNIRYWGLIYPYQPLSGEAIEQDQDSLRRALVAVEVDAEYERADPLVWHPEGSRGR